MSQPSLFDRMYVCTMHNTGILRRLAMNSLVNTTVAMEIGEPEGDVVPVGRHAVSSLVGVHRDVVERVRPPQPDYGKVKCVRKHATYGSRPSPPPPPPPS